MNNYIVQREFTSWEAVIIEADTEAEALLMAKESQRNLAWEDTEGSEPTGYWNVLPAEPTKEITE